MEHILNLDNQRNSTNKIFLGRPLGIINLVDCKYDVFKRLYKDQLSFYWLPDEISMLKDRSDISTLNETERFIFEANLSFQTLGDSFLGKGIDTIIKYVTLNEVYLSLVTHSFFEAAVHTPSYSHVIEGIYNEPIEKFYSILSDPEIVKRAKESTDKFDQLLNSKDKDLRLQIAGTLAGLLALESISFYNSFLTSFFFAKNGKMTGAGAIIKLINRDESMHRANSINIFKLIFKNENEGFWDLRDEIKEIILSSFRKIAEQEFDWIDYLLSKGELSGLTKKGLKRYVQYLTNRAVIDIGFGKEDFIFEETANPFPWVNSFQSSSKSTQVAPQEQEIVNYVKSSKNDLDDMKF